jgi:hypothetical protein
MAEAETPRDWVVEPYVRGDEQAILELFNREFGQARAMEHWRWKFLTNPFGGPFISLAWHAGERFLVGNQVLMPFPFNLGGERRLGGHSLDLVVHHDFRRQGIFEKTGKHAIANLEAQGGAAVIAFPNASSYPGFVRSLGWSRILVPSRWTLRLGVRGKVTRKTGVALAGLLADALIRPRAVQRVVRQAARSRAATPELAVRHLPRLPEGVDVLWAREAKVTRLSLWKDRAYLAWRYEQNPDHDFTFHALEGKDGLEGLAVSVVRGGIATLCEFLLPSRDPASAARLRDETSAHLARAGAEEIHFFGHDPGFFAQVFAGFAHREAAANVFVGRFLGEGPWREEFVDPASWTLTYGDGDFV